jgi:hypothetical protein
VQLLGAEAAAEAAWSGEFNHLARAAGSTSMAANFSMDGAMVKDEQFKLEEEEGASSAFFLDIGQVFMALGLARGDPACSQRPNRPLEQVGSDRFISEDAIRWHKAWERQGSPASPQRLQVTRYTDGRSRPS